MSDSAGPPGESAIEREIRLANEREELLRQEKEARLQAQQQQEEKQAVGKVTTAAFEADGQQTGETTRASFHELTEADRGSEMWQRERLIQQELLEQQQKEEEVRRRAQPAQQAQQQFDQADGSASSAPPSTESVIEREIRLQREREEELKRQRQAPSQKSPRPDTLPTSSPAPVPAPSPAPSPAHPEVQSDINHNEAKAMSGGGGQPPSFQHEGESIIARELRELREREEELRRLREGRVYVESPREEVKAGHALTPSSANHHAPSASTTPTNHPAGGGGSSNSSWQRDVSPYLMPAKRSGSVDSLASSHSTGRTPSDATPSREVKVTPFQDSSPTEEDAPPVRVTETPIAREIRLARERENELRRAKGLPELPPVTPTQGSAEAQSPSSGNSNSGGGGGGTARYRGLDSGNTSTMKKFASGRLQQEILVQKQRELDLRKEGKIITTSEEHIEPLKYADVIGDDRSSGAGKRNFTTRKTPTYSLATDLKVEIDEVDSGRPGKGAASSSSSPGDATLQRRKVSGAPATFSYKESKQSAESKIERELREMREREEELRSRRGKDGAVTNGEGAARD